MLTQKAQLSKRLLFPWSQSSYISTVWHKVEMLFSEEKITYIDCAIAYQLLSPFKEISQSQTLFICYLSSAARRGHLCVDLSTDNIQPSLEDVWQMDEKDEEIVLFNRMIKEAAQTLPLGLVSEVEDIEGKAESFTPLCKFGDLYYLQKYWMAETHCLKALMHHLKQLPEPAFNAVLINEILAEKEQKNLLTAEQKLVIQAASSDCITLIAGGPGTGKTHTVGELIQTLWLSLGEAERTNFNVVLAAPTGKAAAALQKSLARAFTDCIGFSLPQAKTLHALLGKFSGYGHEENIQLEADLIIVDESSMIDIKMMTHLLQSLKPYSRLILIGDPFQLAAVEAGLIFSDFLTIAKEPHGFSLSAHYLTKCLRTQTESLNAFASQINQGNVEAVLQTLKDSPFPAIKSRELEKEPALFYQTLWKYVQNCFCFSAKEDHDQLFAHFQNFRLLSPLRQGPFGVEAINAFIYEKIRQQMKHVERFVVPIMIVTNDYRQQLFNGETGLLVCKHVGSFAVEPEYALFPNNAGNGDKGGLRKISAFLLPKYEYAYCLSVHKSQGSEFDHVLLLVPEGSEIFGREIIYTAVTRAKKKVEIWMEPASFLKTIQKKSERLSGFKERFISYLYTLNLSLKDSEGI